MRGVTLLAWLMALTLPVAAVAAEQPKTLTGLTKHSDPKFPVGLRGAMSGDAQVVLAFTVDTNGKVSDSVALEATQVEFANAATAAVMEWQFEPVAASVPAPRREVVEFAFRRNGVVTTLQHMEAAIEGFNTTTRHPDIVTVKPEQLDVPLQRLSAAMPKLTKAQLELQGATPLIINFLVDTRGHVKVPVATVADPSLLQPVLDAVRQWRYAPPMRNGTPVLVEMTRSLVVGSGGAAVP